MNIVFFIFLAVFLINLSNFRIRAVRKETLVFLSIVLCFGFWVRNSNYIYGMGVDGVYYQEMAKYMYENNLLAQRCAIGNAHDCKYYYSAVVLPGYPYLITLLFKIFGTHDLLAMALSGLLGSLTIILVFLIYYLLFNNEEGALYASAIYALLPLDIFISSTGAVRTTAIFFMCLTYLFFFLFLKNKKKISLLILFALAYSITAYIRSEYYVILIPLAVAMLFKNGSIKKDVFWGIILATAVFLVHQIFAIDWLLHSKFGLTGGSKATFSFSYIARNTWKILTIFYKGCIFSPIINISFIYAIYYFIVHKKFRLRLFVIFSWFLVFFIGISSFYATEAGNEIIRYLQPLGAPYSILCAFGIHTYLKNKIKQKNRIALIVALIFIVSFPFINRNLRFSLFNDGRLQEESVNFFYRTYKLANPNSIILSFKSQPFNFDFMRNKSLKIFTYGQNQFDEYPGFKEVFYNELKKNINSKIYFMFTEDACAENKYCNLIRDVPNRLVISQGNLFLYEVLDKDELLERYGKILKIKKGQ